MVAIVENKEDEVLLRAILKAKQCVIYTGQGPWCKIRVVCMNPVCKDVEVEKCISCYTTRNFGGNSALERNRTIALFRNHPALIHLMWEIRFEGDH